MTEQDVQISAENTQQDVSTNKRIRQTAWIIIGVLAVFLLGLGSGYLTWGQDDTAEWKQQKELATLYEQVNPKDGYSLPISYGNLGPQLLESGDAFAAIYENSGNPLSAEQTEILKNASNKEIVINAGNSHFLLNFFWAVGLANKNSILTDGSMVQNSGGQLEFTPDKPGEYGFQCQMGMLRGKLIVE